MSADRQRLERRPQARTSRRPSLALSLSPPGARPSYGPDVPPVEVPGDKHATPETAAQNAAGARAVRRAPPRRGVYQESRALERGVERGGYEVGVRDPARPELLRRRTRDAPSAQRSVAFLGRMERAQRRCAQSGALEERDTPPCAQSGAQGGVRGLRAGRPRRAWGGDLQTGGAIGAVRGLRGGGGGSLQGASQQGGTARVLSWRASLERRRARGAGAGGVRQGAGRPPGRRLRGRVLRRSAPGVRRSPATAAPARRAPRRARRT